MRIFLFSAIILCVTGNRLTEKENGQLQKTCGRTHLEKPKTFRKSRGSSMNTSVSSRNEAPFTVLLKLSFEDGTPKQRLRGSLPYCSGTIISPRHILTAAHCLTEGGYSTCNDNHTIEAFVPVYDEENTLFKLNYFIVTAPTYCNKINRCDTQLESLIAKPKRAFVSKAYLNHNCKPPVNGNIHGDVAVIELEKDINFSETVQPACIDPNAGFGIPLSVYGYGVIEEENLYSAGILRKHESYKMKKQQCRKYIMPEAKTDLTEEQTLFEFPNGTFRILADDVCTSSKKSMACDGDSGSGLVFKKGKRTSVAAVTSFGPDCYPDMEYPDGYMDVSASLHPHINWIWAATGIHSAVSNYSQEEIARFMDEVYTFEPHPNFDIEVAMPSSPGQKATRMIFPKKTRAF